MKLPVPDLFLPDDFLVDTAFFFLVMPLVLDAAAGPHRCAGSAPIISSPAVLHPSI